MRSFRGRNNDAVLGLLRRLSVEIEDSSRLGFYGRVSLTLVFADGVLQVPGCGVDVLRSWRPGVDSDRPLA
jgi:hypothetical protein